MVRALESIRHRLGSIEGQQEQTNQHLRNLNGKTANHAHDLAEVRQTVYGPAGRGGLVDDVAELKSVPWRAIMSVAAVASVVVSLLVGMGVIG